MGRTLQETLTARDTLIFLWPVISLKKSVLHPVKQIRFLVLIIYTETSEKKFKYVSQRCQETFTQRKRSILNLTKLNVIDCLSHFTSTNPVSMHLTGTNIRSTEKGVLQWSCDTSEFMVHGKLSTLQWEKTQQRELHTIIIHIDVKRLRAYCEGVSTGGNGQRRSIFT